MSLPAFDDAARRWRCLAQRDVLNDRWLHVRAERLQLPDGGVILDPFYVLDETDWACALPLLPDGRLVLVSQYRRGADRVTLEFPAGDLEAGEDPARCAERELAEETGYRAAGSAQPLGSLHPEPARNRSVGHGFLIEVEAVPGPTRLEPGESAQVHLLMIDEVERAQEAGRFGHAVHQAFFYQALRRGLLPN